MADKVVTFAGQIDVKKVELTSIPTDKVVDLSKIMLELNIYEDIFSNYITGTITIKDSVDLINYMPLIGEERLQITYKTTGLSDGAGLVDNMFYVYKISDRTLVSEGSQVYIIHFMSEEAYFDQRVKLNRVYKGNFGTMASSIFNDDDALGVSKKVGDKFLVEETGNAFQFLPPNWTPMKALNWIASRSVSRYGKAANYVFYQDSYNYNFVSINSLIGKEPSMKFYNTTLNIRQLENIYKGEAITQYNIVRSMSNDLIFDVSSRAVSGMYASTMIACDLLSKTVNVQKYDFRNEFDTTNHLNKYPMNSTKVARNPKACTVVYTSHINMWEEFSSDYPETWLLQRRSLMQQINSYKAEIVVPGRSDYKCGMTIQLEMNTVRNHSIDSEEALEVMHKGKYLVTGIMHRIAKNEHECIMSLAKESIITNLG